MTADELTWEEIEEAIFQALWTLAPREYQASADRDIVFGVTMQDLVAVVQDAITQTLEKHGAEHVRE